MYVHLLLDLLNRKYGLKSCYIFSAKDSTLYYYVDYDMSIQ